MEVRPIDANALPYGPAVIGDEGGWTEEIIAIPKNAVDDAPTLDYAPVRHGEWKFFTTSEITERVTSWAQCSECSVMYHLHPGSKYNFCPQCGAKMDLKGDL